GSANLQQTVRARGDYVLSLSLRMQARALHELVCASKIRKQLIDLKTLGELGKNPRIVQHSGADTIRIVSFGARDGSCNGRIIGGPNLPALRIGCGGEGG